MLRQFERRAHHYLQALPRPANKLDWLSLIQHYGGPTRLLDFSHSFYIAAFFAVERAERDAAIWAVNLDKIERRIAAEMKVPTSNENIDHRNTRHAGLVNLHLGLEGRPASPTQLAVNVEPDHLHERLTIQQGFFLVPTDITTPFEVNLASTFGTDVIDFRDTKEVEWSQIEHMTSTFGVLKIILPRVTHKRALYDLQSMNINSATLFPGLDGFARSMHFHLRFLDPEHAT